MKNTIDNIKALRSKDTIVLHYKGDALNIQRERDAALFDSVSKMIDEGNIDELIQTFIDVKSRIEDYTNDHFTVDNGQLKLKGTSEYMPNAVAKKLLELESAKADFMPLIRFWKKLAQNPSENSRAQLYAFMQHNNMSLTEQGDIVVEKGVSPKRNGLPGELVDAYTGKFDNSIGMIVTMPREQVQDNPDVACDRGLHVAPPKYVRNWYGDRHVIVECIVNPADVVSVPHDYGSTKMRVCRYQVVGYAGSSPRVDQVVALNEFIEFPQIGTSAHDQMSKKVKSVGALKNVSEVEVTDEVAESIDGMTAKEIIDYVKKVTGELIEISLKNKKAIIKKALEILDAHTDKLSQPEVDLTDKSAREIQAIVKQELGVSIGGLIPRKARILKKAIELFTQANFKIKS